MSSAKKVDLMPLENMTMADRVEARLREYFKQKKLKPGDPVPKEIELAEALGVSRNVVREALSRFRMLGLVETKKKRGMLVARPDIFSGFERLLDPTVLEMATLKEIFELRLVIELGLADLIFIRKTEQDIKDLEKILKKDKNRGLTPFRLENEVEFHGKLYQMTGNGTLSRFQSMLLPLFEFVLEMESKESGRPKAGKVTHTDLVEILKTGTPTKFRTAMAAHLMPHFDRLAQ